MLRAQGFRGGALTGATWNLAARGSRAARADGPAPAFRGHLGYLTSAISHGRSASQPPAPRRARRRRFDSKLDVIKGDWSVPASPMLQTTLPEDRPAAFDTPCQHHLAPAYHGLQRGGLPLQTNSGPTSQQRAAPERAPDAFPVQQTPPSQQTLRDAGHAEHDRHDESPHPRRGNDQSVGATVFSPPSRRGAARAPMSHSAARTHGRPGSAVNRRRAGICAAPRQGVSVPPSPPRRQPMLRQT